METGRQLTEHWYSVLQTDIRAILQSRTSSQQVLEDVLSDTAEAALRSLEKGTLETITPGWLNVVAQRRLVDHWRSASGQRHRQGRLCNDRALCPAAWCEAPEEQSVDVPEWLDHLPERQRHALLLRYVGGYRVSEVAATMNCGYKATESLLARARRNARALVSVEAD